MDRFGLSDIRSYAYHGVADHERSVGQWFSVDIELQCDLAHAGAEDDLAAAIDYRDAARLVVEVGGRGPVRLLERVAQGVAEALLDTFAVDEARVRIRKFSPPAPGVPGTAFPSRRASPGPWVAPRPAARPTGSSNAVPA